MKIDFQGLLEVAKATEERPDHCFHMGNWSCGTSACMVGSFCEANPKDALRLDYIGNVASPVLRVGEGFYAGCSAISSRFGTTVEEARWLFAENPLGSPWVRRSGPVPASAVYFNKKEALQRLRKFIYYKLKKQEMIVETGRNNQRVDLGREVSGNRAACLAVACA